MYKHIFLENIKKLCKYYGKFYDQHKYKAIIGAEIVSTPEGLMENIPMDVGTLGTMNNPIEINPPSPFLPLLDVTQKIFP